MTYRPPRFTRPGTIVGRHRPSLASRRFSAFQGAVRSRLGQGRRAAQTTIDATGKVRLAGLRRCAYPTTTPRTCGDRMLTLSPWEWRDHDGDRQLRLFGVAPTQGPSPSRLIIGDAEKVEGHEPRRAALRALGDELGPFREPLPRSNPLTPPDALREARFGRSNCSLRPVRATRPLGSTSWCGNRPDRARPATADEIGACKDLIREGQEAGRHRFQALGLGQPQPAIWPASPWPSRQGRLEERDALVPGHGDMKARPDADHIRPLNSRPRTPTTGRGQAASLRRSRTWTRSSSPLSLRPRWTSAAGSTCRRRKRKSGRFSSSRRVELPARLNFEISLSPEPLSRTVLKFHERKLDVEMPRRPGTPRPPRPMADSAGAREAAPAEGDALVPALVGFATALPGRRRPSELEEQPGLAEACGARLARIRFGPGPDDLALASDLQARFRRAVHGTSDDKGTKWPARGWITDSRIPSRPYSGCRGAPRRNSARRLYRLTCWAQWVQRQGRTLHRRGQASTT